MYSRFTFGSWLGKALGATALAATPLLASAQSKVIPADITREVGPAVVMSTNDFNPQINTNLLPGRSRISENPNTPIDYSGDVPNRLRPGSMMSRTRGSAPRIKFGGPGFTGGEPPDCDMAVGPANVVAVVNTTIAIYTKTGTKLFQQNMDNTGFFSAVGGNNLYSDPKVIYDTVSQRWFALILEIDFSGNASKVDLAVSDDNNPMGTWFQYGIDVKLSNGGTDYWMDYPALGCNKDALAISGNMFGFSSGYFGAEVVIIPKAPLLTGSAVTTKTALEAGGGGLEVCRTTDGTVNYIYGISRGGTTSIKAFALSNLLSTTPTLTITPVTVPTLSFNNYDFPAGSALLDGFDSRIFTAAWRNGKMVGAHSIDKNGKGAARWYQFSTGSWPASGVPTLVQSGDVASSAAHFHMPAINVNSLGDVAMAFTRSSSTIKGDLCVAARTAADPPGAMGAPILVASSPANYIGGRWGDFFAVCVDPTDDTTFWCFGETTEGSGLWTTWVNSFQVSVPGGSTGVPADAISITPVLGVFTGGDLTSVATSDNLLYNMNSVLVDRNYNPPGSGAPLLGQVTEVEELFQINPDLVNLATLKVKVEARAASGVNGMVYVWNSSLNLGAGGWEYIQSFSMTAGDRANTITLKPSKFPLYINGNREVRIRVRAIAPVRQGRPTLAPAPFTFGADQIQLMTTRNP